MPPTARPRWMRAGVLDHYKNLTEQAKKLFGAQHFRDYHFLYSLSDHVAHFGLEHHESNDSRVVNAIWSIRARTRGSRAAAPRVCAFVERKIPAAGGSGHA